MSNNKLKSNTFIKYESKNIEKKNETNHVKKLNSISTIKKKGEDNKLERVTMNESVLNEGDKIMRKKKIVKKLEETNDKRENMTTSVNINEEGKRSIIVRRFTQKNNMNNEELYEQNYNDSNNINKNENNKIDNINNNDNINDNENINNNVNINNNENINNNVNINNNENINNSNMPVVRKVIKRVIRTRVKNKKDETNKILNDNLNNNESTNDISCDVINKYGKTQDSDDEILNSIIQKKNELVMDTPTEGNNKELIQKKKKKIIVRKINVSGKNKKNVPDDKNVYAEKYNYSEIYNSDENLFIGNKENKPNMDLSVFENKKNYLVEGQNYTEMLEDIENKSHDNVMDLKDDKKKIKDYHMNNNFVKDLNDEIKSIKEDRKHIQLSLDNKIIENNEMKQINTELLNDNNKIKEINKELINEKSYLSKEMEILERKIKESNEMYNLLNDKYNILENENKMLLDRDNEKELKIQDMQEEKLKLKKIIEENNSLLKKKEEQINEYINEIENYKIVLKSKGEMLLQNSSTMDKNLSSDKNLQKEYVSKLNKENKELIYVFKKQLDLIVILKKQINLLQNNKILNITSNEFKKIMQD
ncbi:conserved Plasmodium protein, unknown function [Plasmodium sp. gorilla clade G3]|nr:conserved Plasmodium protein, unknown function [Plasmodium sp. gorilla clade G3]